MNKVAKYINQYITGAAYSTPSVLDAYSTDRSILHITPKIVAVPASTADIRKIINFSYQLAAKKIELHVTVRGSGTTKTGASIGSGILVSLEKMNKVEEIDPHQRLVRLQTGVRLDVLQNTLALYGLYFPYEGPAGTTISDLISENIILNRSVNPGQSILDYILQAEVVLSNGDAIHVEALNMRQYEQKKLGNSFEAKLYGKVASILKKEDETIKTLPDFKTNRAGYNGAKKLISKNKINLLPLFIGAENTLGVVTEIILRCELLADAPQYCAIVCPDINTVKNYSKVLLGLAPTALDFYDLRILNEAESFGKKLNLWPKTPEDGFLIVAKYGDQNILRRNQKIKHIKKNLPSTAKIYLSDAQNYHDFQELNAIISTYCNNAGSANRLPILDDVYVPNTNLQNFMEDLGKLCKASKIELLPYGSLLHENYNVRPKIKLSDNADRKRALILMKEYAKIINNRGGNLAGGSAEGRLKAIFCNPYTSRRHFELYDRIQRDFDPRNIMNPGVKHNATPRSVVRELRSSYNLGIVEK